LLQVFAAAAAWITAMTLSLSYIFNHFPGKLLDPIYKFVRDSRLAEITLQVYEPNYFYRVFMPSQLFVVIAVTLLLAMLLTLWRKERLPLPARLGFVLLSAASLLSLSRSFALGFAAAALLIGLFVIIRDHREYKIIVRRVVSSLILALGGFALALLTVVFPLPSRPDLTEAAFYQTSSEVGRSAGVASRWQLFEPLQAKIAESPIWGSGFGTEVTYQSSDPRIIEETGDGQYTTFRFEWGYQDLWVKMGLLGLLAYLVFLFTISRAIRKNLAEQTFTWLPLGLGGGLMVLFVTHIFSPYLNHPIGLGLMLFALPFLDFDEWKKSWVALSLPQKISLPSQEMTPAMAEISPEIE
jgi:O-antigen ligase